MPKSARRINDDQHLEHLEHLPRRAAPISVNRQFANSPIRSGRADGSKLKAIARKNLARRRSAAPR
jgi:hypothetical protein